MVTEVSYLPTIPATEARIQRTVSVVAGEQYIPGCVTPLRATNSDDLPVVLNCYCLEDVIVIEVLDPLTITIETCVPGTVSVEASDGCVVTGSTVFYIADDDNLAVRVNSGTFSPVMFGVVEVRSQNTVTRKGGVFVLEVLVSGETGDSALVITPATCGNCAC